ncbi:MAG TPA: hypothetical protein VE642_10590, partial [Pyrinomonadaceae bacterium]|nr:hypothetical protein [Pyrinomonadaceae bacterium]
KLARPRVKLSAPASVPVEMPYDLDAAGPHGEKSPASFDAAGRSLPSEMLPRDILFGGVRFQLAPGTGANALVARGQTINLPKGNFKRLYLLAASAEGDRRATFRAGERPFELTIQDWGGFIGQWDARQWRAGERQVPPGATPETAARIREPEYRQDPYAEMTGIRPGFIKPAPLAWFASHRHDARGASEAYAYSYLFAYALDLPPGAKTLTLPDDERIRVLAVTVSDESARVIPARPLFDTLERGAQH